MGANGEDVMLSPAARRKFPISIECKSLARFAGYTIYDQAASNAGKYEPVCFVKANRRSPLAIVDAEWFVELMKERNFGARRTK